MSYELSDSVKVFQPIVKCRDGDHFSALIKEVLWICFDIDTALMAQGQWI